MKNLIILKTNKRGLTHLLDHFLPNILGKLPKVMMYITILLFSQFSPGQKLPMQKYIYLKKPNILFDLYCFYFLEEKKNNKIMLRVIFGFGKLHQLKKKAGTKKNFTFPDRVYALV